MEAIRSRYGPTGIARYDRFGSDAAGRRVALFTDDTQMVECVGLALVDGGSSPERAVTMRRMAEQFVAWSRAPVGGHRAPGNACLAGCRALASGADWQTAGGATAGGCGSVMRAHPVGIRFAFADIEERAWWAVAQSLPTHRDPIALAASAALVEGVAGFLHGSTDRLVFANMTSAAARHDFRTAGMMCRALDAAERGVDAEKVYGHYQGWAAHEAIAAATFAAARHPGETVAAVLEAANTPGDSDSIASIAGALLGARNGAESLPDEWTADLERVDDLRQLADDLAELAVADQAANAAAS